MNAFCIEYGTDVNYADFLLLSPYDRSLTTSNAAENILCRYGAYNPNIDLEKEAPPQDVDPFAIPVVQYILQQYYQGRFIPGLDQVAYVNGDVQAAIWVVIDEPNFSANGGLNCQAPCNYAGAVYTPAHVSAIVADAQQNYGSYTPTNHDDIIALLMLPIGNAATDVSKCNGQHSQMQVLPVYLGYFLQCLCDPPSDPVPPRGNLPAPAPKPTPSHSKSKESDSHSASRHSDSKSHKSDSHSKSHVSDSRSNSHRCNTVADFELSMISNWLTPSGQWYYSGWPSWSYSYLQANIETAQPFNNQPLLQHCLNYNNPIPNPVYYDYY